MSSSLRFARCLTTRSLNYISSYAFLFASLLYVCHEPPVFVVLISHVVPTQNKSADCHHFVDDLFLCTFFFPHLDVHLEEVTDWPGLKLKLGQVSGLALDPNDNLVIFHRGNHVWDEK